MVDLLMNEKQKELSKFSYVHTVEDDLPDKSNLSGILKYKYFKTYQRHHKYQQANEGRIINKI